MTMLDQTLHADPNWQSSEIVAQNILNPPNRSLNAGVNKLTLLTTLQLPWQRHDNQLGQAYTTDLCRRALV